MTHPSRGVRLAIDIGGTFTDLEFARLDTGATGSFKTPTTPEDFSIGFIDAITGAAERFGFALADVRLVMHGTTIATNAVLTRSLPEGALVTTAGFEDVLEIGRQARRDVYGLKPEVRALLVPRRRRFGVMERIGARGEVVAALDPATVADVVEKLRASSVGVAAICLINAHANPAHEIVLRDAVAAALPGLRLSCSHEVSPEIREFERASTTVLNALLMPVAQTYVERLQARLAEAGLVAPLYLVQSNGGAAPPEMAARTPVKLLLSGPSGGVLAAERLAARLGLAQAVGVDMGGTSYDVALIQDGRRAVVAQGEIDGLPVRTPMVEMRTIGAGGGSIATVENGRLRVGPESAGATPGPVCYGQGGTEPTTTDANVILGRLDAVGFMRGALPLDRAAAAESMRVRVAEPLGLTVEAAAEGVLAVVTAKLAGAIKLSLFERGLDPRDFALMSFGGAGGLHACEVAEELGMTRVVFPKDPSTFSAHGILQSDIVHDLTRARLTTLAAGAAETISADMAALAAEGRGLLGPGAAAELRFAADLRYRGQAFELMLPLAGEDIDAAGVADLTGRFHTLHRQRFSFDDPAETVELTTLRLAAVGLLGAPPEAKLAGGRRSPPPSVRMVRHGGEEREFRIVRQGDMGQGAIVDGPAIVEQAYTSLLAPAGWRLTMVEAGDMVAEATHERRRFVRPHLEPAERLQPFSGTPVKTDPILLEIVAHALVAAAEEMSVTVWRTSRSTTVRELLDYSTAVFDGMGRNVAQAARMPVHLNSMELCLREIVARHIPLEEWRDGDVIVTNDPYAGGQHLPDFLAFKPVFAEGRRVAIACALIHHVDVGGGAAGGYNARAVEIHQEGLRVPPVRIVRAGEMQEDLLRAILANVRDPETFRGDFLSQIAAVEMGARSIRALTDRYGIETVLGISEALLDHSEAAMRAAIRALPDGVYAADDFVDGDGLEPGRKRIAVTLTIAGDELRVDLAGTSPQAMGPINATMATTKSAVYYAAIAAAGVAAMANSGCYRPIAVTAPEGSLVNARFPAPVSMRMLTGHRIATAVLKAFARAVPERIPASYYGVTFNHAINVLHGDGRRQVYFDASIGGWGAHPQADGPSGFAAGFHNGQNTPVEMVEAIFPLRFKRYGFSPDTGGAGRMRGGLGLERSWEFLAERGLFNGSFDAFESRPYGLAGGEPGQGGRLTVTRDGVTTELPAKTIGHELRAGDVLSMVTPGGGGFGDPRERAAAALAEDMADGLVTAEGAKRYGR
jgi:N-methylhydantoinase A/oxoprolinase/acetone carboxylase beta subunit/N-methylhydantoinase B/oxoprolinase/acetone carboxylase alpha subunit